MAPTRPLVEQQIEACHRMCGFRQEEIAIMTGKLQPLKRDELWRRRKIFFLTAEVPF